MTLIDNIISFFKPSRQQKKIEKPIREKFTPPSVPFPQIPEIINHVLEYLPQTAHEYSNFGKASVQFYLASHTFMDFSKVQLKNMPKDWSHEHLAMQLWKNMVLAYWPNFDPNSNTQNWVKVFKRRIKKQNKLLLGENLITDCPQMAFKCPLKFEDLQTTENEGIRFCNKCEKQVFHCDNDKQLASHREARHCVAFFVKVNNIEEEWMGDIYIPETYEGDTFD